MSGFLLRHARALIVDDGTTNVSELIDATVKGRMQGFVEALDSRVDGLEPTPPNDLDTPPASLTANNTTLVTGLLSAGAPNTFITLNPQDSVNFILEDDTFDFTLPGTYFNNGDNGIVSLRVNGSEVDTFDLGAAFVEADRDAGQGANYNGGGGIPATSVGGNITILGVAPGGQRFVDVGIVDFPYRWMQQVDVRINITPGDLQAGENEIVVRHVVGGDTRDSQLFRLFFDSDGARPSIAAPAIVENTLNSSAFTSGIRHYAATDSFDLSCTINGPVNNTFSNTLLIVDLQQLTSAGTFGVGVFDAEIAGLGAPPAVGDVATYAQTYTLGAPDADFCTLDGLAGYVGNDPFGSGAQQNTASENRIVNTWTQGSTSKLDLFVDELFRLKLSDPGAQTFAGDQANFYSLSTDVDPDGSAVAGQEWNSSAALADGDMAVACGLRHPKHAGLNGGLLVGNFLPTQVNDYDGFVAAEQDYCRCFATLANGSTGTIKLAGITSYDEIQDGNGAQKYEVYLRFPDGETEWVNLGKEFPGFGFTGAFNEGIHIPGGAEGIGEFQWNIGTKTTANSDNKYFVYIRCLAADAPVITRLEELDL